MAGSHKAQATPNVGITTETLNQQFATPAASGSYAHAVNAGSNVALVVTIGTTAAVVSIASVQWDPDTTVSGNEQAMSCPAANQLTMGTGRKLAICTLLTPTPSSGNGQIAITFSGGTDTFTSSATTFTGVSGFRTPTTSGAGKTFGTWPACTLVGSTSTYTCSVAASTSTDDVVFDLVGQGEQALPAGLRTFTPGSGQTKHDDSPTVTNAPHLRIATSIAIASGSSTTMTWTYGNATSSNGVGQVVLPMIPASTVTAARLGIRTAVRYGMAGTRIAWQTEEEASHLGFQVWRERRGARTRVGRGLIPGSTFATGVLPLAGRRGYETWDDGGQPGDRYWLEEIAAHAPPRWHGPLAAAAGDAAAGRAVWRGGMWATSTLASPAAPAPAAPVVSRPPLPDVTPGSACANPAAWGPAVKIAVSAPGWIHVDASALAAAGLPADADPSALALWVDGQPVGLRTIGRDPLEAIEFYGRGTDTHDTGTRIYWLVTDQGGGRPIPFGPSTSGDSAAPLDSSLAEVTLRDRSVYVAALLNGRADNFFGDVLSTSPVNQVLEVPDPVPGQPATLVVALQGVTADAHQADVTLNGTGLGTVAWSGFSPVVQELAIPPDLLVDGSNTVVLTPTAASGVAVIDHLTVRYARPYRAIADRLEATAPGGARLRVTGFSRPDVRAFDVTDPNGPFELAGAPLSTADGYGLLVQAPAGGGARIVRVQSSAGLAAPDAVTANAPSGICQAAGAEVAVLAPRAFFAALTPWVAARRAAGWSVELDDIEDVFDEMTFGAHRAAAITDFVRVRRAGPDPRTRYLLLAGSASLDPRNFLGKNVTDWVPTALIDTDVIETASDEALADLDGDGVAELALGRWPARTAEELSTMVAATLSLEGARPFDATPLVVTATNGDPQFLAFAQTLAGVLPTSPDRFDPQGLSAEDAHAGLLARWSSGPGFIQYFGHGSEQIWQGLLSTDEVEGLPQTGRRPVISAMTCLNGMFQDVYQDCLASRLMRAQAGAAAVWASADLTDAGAQGALAAAFAAGARSMALGAAAHAARVATGGAGRAMVLFGDPTLFGTPSPSTGTGGGAGGGTETGAGPPAAGDAGAADAGQPPAASGAGGVPGPPGKPAGGCAVGPAPTSGTALAVGSLALVLVRRRRRVTVGRR
jgi:MYXO-CTERM domain-containing protein